MYPTLRDGSVGIFIGRKPRMGSIVLAKRGGREIVKRVQRIEDEQFYLVGDNSHASTDSRHYGSVSKRAILGVIMVALPTPINPPKPMTSHGTWFGRIAAAILVIMALVHLFRIDTFVPLLDTVLPGGEPVAGLSAVAIIMSEVFAVPFALRMKLSPLGHICSGALLILAPLWWLLISMWSYASADNIGLLGAFVDVKSTAAVVALCAAWVYFNYYALYALGYNRLNARLLLKK